MTERLPVGVKAYALRSVCDPRRPLPLIILGEEVTILRHVLLEGKHGLRPGYLVRTANDMNILALEEDFTGYKPSLPPKSLEKIAKEAFLSGYSEGHRRGLVCGRECGEDGQYVTIIQVAARNYINELRGEHG